MGNEVLLIVESEVGKVIGKKGANINQLKERYGVEIKIHQDRLEANGLIPVHIFVRGDENGDGAVQMAQCKAHIIEHLNSFSNAYKGCRESGGSGVPPDPSNQTANSGFGGGGSGFGNTGGFGGSSQQSGFGGGGSSQQSGFGGSTQQSGFGGGSSQQSGFGGGDAKPANPVAGPAGQKTLIYKSLGGFGRGVALPNVTTVPTFGSSTLTTGRADSQYDKFGSDNSHMFGRESGFGRGTVRQGAFNTTAPAVQSGFQSSSGFSSNAGFQNSGGGGGGFSSGGFSSMRSDGPKQEGQGFSGFSSGETQPRRDYQDFASLLAEVQQKEQEKWARLPQIQKNFYIEHAEITKLSGDDVKEVMAIMKDVRVQDLKKGEPRAIPKITFSFLHSLAPFPELMREVEKNGFSEPSPIQAQLWPILFTGYDAIGIAQTGTGKTLAFLFPAFIHIDNQPIARQQRKGPTVLVLTPTRELAQQIESEVRKYHYKDIRSVCLYGGGSRRDQVSHVREGVEIVIATPGRLNDLVMAGDVLLESITFVVLDEADRMLDMGFEVQISGVLMGIRPDRQTVMTSATWPPSVRRLTEKYMKDPFLVSVGSLDIKACLSVKQMICMVEPDEKYEKLKRFLFEMEKDEKVLVFCGRKAVVSNIASDLVQKENINVETMHGDMDQTDRERALRHLKNGKTKVVIATDVAARGLDVMDITYVLNYDMTGSIDEYVHRIGRTGRAGKSGTAITFVTKYDWAIAGKLVEVLERAQQQVPPQLLSMAERWASKERSGTLPPSRGRGGYGGQRGRARSPPGFYDPITGMRIGDRMN